MRQAILSRPFRKGTGSKIRTQTDMALHLERNHLQVSAATKAEMDDIISARKIPGGTYEIDCEFAGGYMLEICVLNANGETVVDTLVDNEVAEEEILAQSEAACRWQDFKAISASYNSKFQGKRKSMKPEEVAKLLVEDGMTSESKLLEWSTSRCDWHYLNCLMSSTSYADFMPDITNSVLCIPLWREALPGFVCFRLSILFYVVDGDHALISQKHNAKPDAIMLHRLMDVFMNEIGKKSAYKPAGIAAYFTPATRS